MVRQPVKLGACHLMMHLTDYAEFFVTKHKEYLCVGIELLIQVVTTWKS